MNRIEEIDVFLSTGDKWMVRTYQFPGIPFNGLVLSDTLDRSALYANSIFDEISLRAITWNTILNRFKAFGSLVGEPRSFTSGEIVEQLEKRGWIPHSNRTP